MKAFTYLTMILIGVAICSTPAVAGVANYNYAYDPTGGAPMPGVASPSWTEVPGAAYTGSLMQIDGENARWVGAAGAPDDPTSPNLTWWYALDDPSNNGVTKMDSPTGFVFEERYKTTFESFGDPQNVAWGQAIGVDLVDTAGTNHYRAYILHGGDQIQILDYYNGSLNELISTNSATDDTFVTVKYTFKDGNLDVVWNSGSGPNVVPTIALTAGSEVMERIRFGSFSSSAGREILVDYYAWNEIPEPSTFVLLMLAVAGGMLFRRRR